MSHSIRTTGINRRELLTGMAGWGIASFGVIAMTSSTRAHAEEPLEEFPFTGMSIGEMEQIVVPDTYELFSDEVKESLGQALMYQTPNDARTGRAPTGDIGCWINLYGVSGGWGQIGFSFSAGCNVDGIPLYVLVTVSSSNGTFQEKSYDGISYVSRSGTFYNLPGGTYSVVATVHSYNPGQGNTSRPAQQYTSVTI